MSIDGDLLASLMADHGVGITTVGTYLFMNRRDD